MGLIQACKRRAGRAGRVGKDSSGIALFMVLAAISVLSILVTEFTYLAQISQTIAFDGLDQVKAHYLAKSAYKLSLLRLKAYQIVREQIGNAGGAVPGLPKAALEKIWSFPIMYPLPSDIPGLSMTEKDSITKFQKESGLDGSFSALIASESGRYNLNMVLQPFAPQPSPTPSGTGPGGGDTRPGGGQQPAPGPSPTPAPTFSIEESRRSLADYLLQIYNQKVEADQDFADEHRDFRIEDLMDGLLAWVDRTYQKANASGREKVANKGAPFYSLQELHMIESMSDDLFELFAPSLTTSTTPGININTMQENVLRALVPQMTKEEVDDFFKFRDAEDQDNNFRKEEDFYTYLSTNVGAFRGQQAIDEFKNSLMRRNIRLITDETQFRITIQAKVNQSVRLLEAWVTMGTPKKEPKPGPEGGAGGPQARNPQDPGNPADGGPQGTGRGRPNPADAGLKVTFMRIL